MKRRKFLKFLALIPALPIACENPFKPKSKPPPIEPYDPDDDWDEIVGGSQNKGRLIYVGANRVWIEPDGIECKSIQEAIDIIGKMRKA
jgi:hypothetical protein